MTGTYSSYTTPFLSWLALEKRYSPHTIAAYEEDLRQFFAFLEQTYGDIPLAEIHHSFVRSWLAGGVQGREGAQASPRTINRKISTLKSFFKYALKQQWVTQSVMVKITSPKVNKRLPLFVEEKGMQTIAREGELAQPLFTPDLEGDTRRLIIDILYQTGIRLSELIGLQDRQVDVHLRTIKVLGKGNKERIIPVSPELLERVVAYRQRKARELAVYDTDVLLVNAKGKKLYPKYVYNVVKEILSQVTTIEKRSPHILRHTFATHLTNAGADLNAVKELLGHSSLAATQVYTHNTIDRLKEIHSKAHPKA
ncbi:tyrosine-type recombinase/integrase [Chitinophaga horti]|uniref:Tyrosine-type recombinase/integrase n=1 Tax=Chitinophaga horti TaxID=2920382 RepID=A0ABY6J279_9BACT|nr:tyrosine-type recombinase/integrase [Chitinophaga horti]UYQ93755.1 tyrosine-type recombinase/integrase [Chitinophaga horti]